MKHTNLKHVFVVLVIFCQAVTACKGAGRATPSLVDTNPIITSIAIKESPAHLQDYHLCGLSVPDNNSPWRPYWQYADVTSRVSALLKDGAWLWVGTHQGLVRLDLGTLDCTIFEYAGDSLSLADVNSLALDPEGCLWANGPGGTARYCDEASGEGAGWQALPLVYPVYGLGFDAQGDLWTYYSSGRSGMRPLRYEGHEPPAQGEWQRELVDFPTIASPDDCDDWSSASFAPYAKWFQSPQECRTLMTWLRRLDSLDLPPGLAHLDFNSSIATDGKSGWLFARRTHPTPQHPEQYVLLRWSEGQPGGADWLITPWPLAPPRYGTVIVADAARSGVWIGTSDGLIFSDGQTLQHMHLTAGSLVPVGPPVEDVVLDRAGRSWAATTEGLLRFDAEGDRWGPTEIYHAVLIAPDDWGGLWAVSRANEGYISHFDPSGGEDSDGRWQHHSDTWSCFLDSIAADVGGGLWLARRECGLLGFDGRQVIPYYAGFDAANSLLTRRPDGGLYAASPDGNRVQVYDGATWETLFQAEQPGWSVTTALEVDPQGGLWVGYLQPPYLRYLNQGRQDEFSEAVGGPVQALLVDSQGDLWVGLEGALLRYDGKGWERIPVEKYISVLAQGPQGRLWVGDWEGFYAYDPTKE
jgi:hypothetical protein